MTLAVAAAVGLALALGGDDAARVDGRDGQDPGALGGAGAKLAPLDGAGDRVAGDTSGPTTWTVHALTAEGLPAEGATIAATREAESLRGDSVAAWTDVAPGTWRLVVSDGENPEIARDVAVVRGRENTTYVTLGAPVRVSGRVINTRGEGLKDHLVCFLRPGEDIPSKPRGFRRLTSASTDSDGDYAATLPEAARWRPIVVFNGRVLIEGAFEEVPGDGVARRCDIVVPASPRLVILLDDPASVVPEGGIAALSVYRMSTPLEVAQDEEMERLRAEAMARQAGEPEPERSAEQILEEAGALVAENDPERQARLAQQAKWRRVVPEGFRRVASSVIPPPGVLVFDHLQHDVEYRMALRLGQEVFRVAPSVFLGNGEIVETRLMPPAPRPGGAPDGEPLRTVPILVEPIPSVGDRPREGVIWS